MVLALFFAWIVLQPTITIISHDGISNGIIFGVILGVVETAIYVFFYKADETNARIQTKIMEECENQGISISEYVEKGYEDGTFL